MSLKTLQNCVRIAVFEEYLKIVYEIFGFNYGVAHSNVKSNEIPINIMITFYTQS